MKIVSRPQFEYRIYERKNGKKFIKILKAARLKHGGKAY